MHSLSLCLQKPSSSLFPSARHPSFLSPSHAPSTRSIALAPSTYSPLSFARATLLRCSIRRPRFALRMRTLAALLLLVLPVHLMLQLKEFYTPKFAAQMASKQQQLVLKEIKKPIQEGSSQSEDVAIIDAEEKGVEEQPVPMFVQHTEAILDDVDEMWTLHPFIVKSKKIYTVLIWCRVLAFLVFHGGAGMGRNSGSRCRVTIPGCGVLKLGSCRTLRLEVTGRECPEPIIRAFGILKKCAGKDLWVRGLWRAGREREA